MRIDPSDFRRTTLPLSGDVSDVRSASDDYRLILLCTLQTILSRYETDPGYHFINTKLSIADGRDFPEGDRLKGKDTIYAWIQGRGLEALAAHDAWIRRQDGLSDSIKENFSNRIHTVLRQVSQKMEDLRCLNNGRLFFMMTASGRPLRIEGGEIRETRLNAEDPTNLSDLFYSKGLVSVGNALGDSALLAGARDLFAKVHNDIRSERFCSDQQSINPKNPDTQAGGRHWHAGRMIGIGGAACFLECTGDRIYQDIGFEYIDHILESHVNLSSSPSVGEQYDMWEFTDDRGEPCVEEGMVHSDPGHSTEFVGLALKLIRIARSKGTLDESDMERVRYYEQILPEVLRKNFANGFARSGYGIVNSLDLISRRAIDSDMAWWSLPETMRAALGAAQLMSEGTSAEFYNIAAKCSNAFLGHYVRPDVHLMATQTLDENGQRVAAIPATPDADPGFHTGLSLIDCLNILDSQA